MRNNESDTVYYFINTLKLDITKFDEVRNISKQFNILYIIYSILLRGVALYNSGWGYYTAYIYH